jgi:hypothetical protein
MCDLCYSAGCHGAHRIGLHEMHHHGASCLVQGLETGVMSPALRACVVRAASTLFRNCRSSALPRHWSAQQCGQAGGGKCSVCHAICELQTHGFTRFMQAWRGKLPSTSIAQEKRRNVMQLLYYVLKPTMSKQEPYDEHPPCARAKFEATASIIHVRTRLGSAYDAMVSFWLYATRSTNFKVPRARFKSKLACCQMRHCCAQLLRRHHHVPGGRRHVMDQQHIISNKQEVVTFW